MPDNEIYFACDNCRFHVNAACHRHAPVIVDGGLIGQWPITFDNEWCGDWEWKVAADG